MRPEANSGALLQVRPLAGTLLGTKFEPWITIQAFCAISPPPLATVTDVMMPKGGPALTVKLPASVIFSPSRLLPEFLALPRARPLRSSPERSGSWQSPKPARQPIRQCR